METQFINLNMTPTGVNPCFHISQYDIGRPLGVKVHNGAEVVDLDSYTCTIEATRSDGVAITASVATNDNVGTFETTATMTNKADKYKAQFVIVDENSKRIASLPFDMNVVKAAMDENSEAIEEDASLYQQYTEAVQGAIAEANADIQAEENARIAAVNAETTARQSADNTLQGNINSEATTRASADSNLQSQINQIVAPSGEAPSAAEVQNARIGADGVTYSTLGEAIRANDNGLRNDLELFTGNQKNNFIQNKYIRADSDTYDLTSPTANNDYCYAVVDANEGDCFTVKGVGGNSPRLWFFGDSSGNILLRADIDSTLDGGVVIAPLGTSKLIVNSRKDASPYLYKNRFVKNNADMANANIAYEAFSIPHVTAQNELKKWSGDVPQTNRVFFPITVLKKTMLLGLKFKSVFSSACTVEVSLRKANGTDILTRNVATLASSGEKTIEVYFPYVLEPSEYRIYVCVSAGYINYPTLSPRSAISNEFFTTTGTAYMYGYSNISFVGEIYYAEMWLNALSESFAKLNDDGMFKYELANIFTMNPNVLVADSWSSNGPTKANNGDITIEQASGNTWFTFKADKTKLINNYVIIDFDIEITRGSCIVWFSGTTTGGNTIYGSQGSVSENTHVTKVVDLNYYVVYESLDLTKDIKFGIGNSGDTLAIVKNFKLTTPKYDFDTSKSFYQNVNEMYKKTQENTNAIIAMSGASYITSPNGTKFIPAVSNDGTLHTVPIVPRHTLFIGNSLLLGNGFGMCASDSTKDYYYKVSQRILELNPNATFEKLAGGTFEGATSVDAANTWMSGVLLPKLDNTVELVIIQLGDNVNTSAKLSTFEQSCTMLIQYIKENAPNARVAWVGEWYSSTQKQTIIANACATKGATFIDITTVHTSEASSHIGAVIDYGVSASRQYTIDGYTDDSTNHELTVTFTINDTQYESVIPYTSYSVSGSTLTIIGTSGIVIDSGVASHPGDIGMEAIANLMLNKLGLD